MCVVGNHVPHELIVILRLCTSISEIQSTQILVQVFTDNWLSLSRFIEILSKPSPTKYHFIIAGTSVL